MVGGGTGDAVLVDVGGRGVFVGVREGEGEGVGEDVGAGNVAVAGRVELQLAIINPAKSMIKKSEKGSLFIVQTSRRSYPFSLSFICAPIKIIVCIQARTDHRISIKDCPKSPELGLSDFSLFAFCSPDVPNDGFTSDDPGPPGLGFV